MLRRSKIATMSGKPLSPAVLHERLVARLRVRHLRLMAALAHCSTLADAAREVGLTQPTASQMLLDLEDLLGQQLFERYRRGMRPTEAGRFLTQQASQLVASVRHTADGLSALAHGRRRPLRIGAIGAAMVALLQPRIALLRSRLTDVEVQVQEGTPDAVEAGLHGGSLELGLLRRPLVPSREPWTWMALLDDDIAVVASPRHPLTRRRSVALAELAGYPWSLPQTHHSTHDTFVAACQAEGFTPERSPWQCVSLELLPTFVDDRRTLAAVPRALVGMALAQGHVREVRLRSSVPLPPLGAVWNAGDPHPSLATLLELLAPAGR